MIKRFVVIIAALVVLCAASTRTLTVPEEGGGGISIESPSQTAGLEETPEKPPETTREGIDAKKSAAALPGGMVPVNIAVRNNESIPMFIFVKVTVPTVPAADILLEPTEKMPDPVPVLSYTPSDSWTLVEDGLYAYGILEPGETSPPLFTEWRITNFRVSGGRCGKYTWEELISLCNEASVVSYGIQADVTEGLDNKTIWEMTVGKQ